MIFASSEGVILSGNKEEIILDLYCTLDKIVHRYPEEKEAISLVLYALIRNDFNCVAALETLKNIKK